MTQVTENQAVMNLVNAILRERAARGGRACKGVKKNIKDREAWRAKSRAGALKRWGKLPA